MTDQVLTLEQVVAYLKLAEKKAYDPTAEGKFLGFNIEGSWRFRRENVENRIEQQKIKIRSK